jgi:D-glycero-D-manno-heptose 1,7-bisphosphate phosphatase
LRRALFLDRDGVLNELVYYPLSDEWEAPRNADDVRIIEAVAAPLRRLAEADWLLFVVTNQPSYAKKKTSREALEQAHALVLERLEIPVTASYICFHHPEAAIEELRVRCDCRKPGIASLLKAAADFDIDLEASWMVGDQDSDLECGRAAGCRVALIEHPGSAHKRGKLEPDLRCDSIEQLVTSLIPTSSAAP